MEAMQEAKQILEAFFHRTSTAKKRYLWTDSFAIVGFVKLDQRKYAVDLAKQVIDVLGKSRTGEWLSGDPNRPTLKGLRIGKPLDERKPNEPYDPDLEWERDGQYYHYATKFAWALQILAETEPSETESTKYISLATDLMLGVNNGFIRVDDGTPKMYWKMDVKLSRPVVPSQGQHDPIDGYITCLNLGIPQTSLQNLKKMAFSSDLVTVDLLGIGGLLMDCARTKQTDPQLFQKIQQATERSLDLFLHMKAQKQMNLPATQRLCFREMGLSIGAAMAKSRGVAFSTDFGSLETAINEFWKVPGNRKNTTYKQHEDINDVMRACSLILGVPQN